MKFRPAPFSRLFEEKWAEKSRASDEVRLFEKGGEAD